jgi:branched-chain amino acid aminotransferase
MRQEFSEANRDLLININGELIHRDLAGVSPFDSLVQGGDGVWEGLRLYDGRIFKLDAHLKRLHGSAKALSFNEIPSIVTLKEEIKKTLLANQMTDGAHIRLTLSRGLKITSGMDPRLNQQGCTLIVLAEHKPPVYDRSGLRLITSSIRRFPPDCLDPKIHSNNLIQSIMAKIEANVAGVDDALMLDTRGFVAETNATHLFLVQDEIIRTGRTVACPEGITRDTILALCRENRIPHEVEDISLMEFYRADEVFCTGTMGELVGVIEIDGRQIGNGAVGPMTEQLSRYYKRLTENSGERILE